MLGSGYESVGTHILPDSHIPLLQNLSLYFTWKKTSHDLKKSIGNQYLLLGKNISTYTLDFKKFKRNSIRASLEFAKWPVASGEYGHKVLTSCGSKSTTFWPLHVSSNMKKKC